MADQGPGQQRPAGWKKDPSGRHFGRYWNGSQWTEHVISAEKVQSVDPLPPRPAPAHGPVGAPPPAPGGPNRLVEPEPAGQWRGPAPTAAGWTADPTRPQGPAPIRPPTNDPGGKGANQVLTAVRGWPTWAKWAAGAAVAVVLVAAAAGGGGENDQPVSVVGDVATTLTVPLPSTAPPVTPAPTTEATAPATTRAPATTAATAPATTAATAPATTGATTPATPDVYYKNCAEVRAAGKDPIYRGQPGYRSGLDRDSDGIACDK